MPSRILGTMLTLHGTKSHRTIAEGEKAVVEILSYLVKILSLTTKIEIKLLCLAPPTFWGQFTVLHPVTALVLLLQSAGVASHLCDSHPQAPWSPALRPAPSHPCQSGSCGPTCAITRVVPVPHFSLHPRACWPVGCTACSHPPSCPSHPHT